MLGRIRQDQIFLGGRLFSQLNFVPYGSLQRIYFFGIPVCWFVAQMYPILLVIQFVKVYLFIVLSYSSWYIHSTHCLVSSFIAYFTH